MNKRAKKIYNGAFISEILTLKCVILCTKRAFYRCKYFIKESRNPHFWENIFRDVFIFGNMKVITFYVIVEVKQWENKIFLKKRNQKENYLSSC